jgi:hypothetical protein
MSLQEQGFLGLRVRNKQILEEVNAAFRYPAFIHTVREMQHNPTVGAAMGVWRTMISRVKWDVEAPSDATEAEKERAKVVRTMMDDMEYSWASFIESIISYLEYGYAINEIVLRRRLKRNGSRWNDGLVGIRKLPTRNQETICGWVFDEAGNELLRVEQDISNVENSYKFQSRKNENGKIEIDRNKFLLFSASASRGNPEGNSIYKPIYLAHKQLSLLADQELLTAAKDMQGALKITVPPRYLDPNASAEDKAVLTAFQKIIDNYASGQQRGLLVPNVIDPESKLPLFTYELLESKGGAKVPLEEVIKRLQNDILSAMSVDVLKLGAEGTGSFSLAQTKTSILALAIDYRLKEISEVLNSHLMRVIFEMNGWDTSRLPKFVYGDIENISLDDLGKYLQRVKSVGLLEVDRKVLNKVREAMGVEPRPSDEEPDVEAMTLTDDKSRSGDSFDTDTGGLNGTSNSVSKKNSSDNNSENAS